MNKIKEKRKKILHKLFASSLCIFFAIIFTVSSFAATNAKGFSVYRQGNIPNPSGHAGLVYKNSVEDSNAIIHVIRGDDNYLIRKTSLLVFEDNQDFYGYYVPKTLKNLSTSDRTNKLSSVISKADALAAIKKDNLGYNLVFQVWYKTDKNNNGRVDIDEITSMRCDGLVEYCYEYYGLSVYGDNITTFNTSIRDNHCAPNVTPKQQIKHYLQNCLGDVDGDLSVTAADSRLALRYSSSLETFDKYQKFVADVDGDGSVNAADSRLILRYSSGLENTFPADPFPS